MKYLVLSSLFFFFLFPALQAQTLCGYDAVVRTGFQSEDEYLTTVRKSNEELSGVNGYRSAIDTFFVVFHIIHRGEPYGTGTNITDEQIQSAMIALNRDFRALPIDDSIAVSPYGTDTEIYFQLACVDPDGNPTNGINRVDGTVVPGYLSEGFHFQTGNTGNNMALTALSDWPVDKYINIWVTHRIIQPDGSLTTGGGFGLINGQFIQGFSGLYLHHRVVGRDVDGTLGYDLANKYGKIPSHEMGHYFSLKHTFEGHSCTETDCTTEGDGICDTGPHTGTVSYAADSTCDEYIECGTREPVENIMNYSGPYCGNVFTPGQKTRMKNFIALHLQNMLKPSDCDVFAGVQSTVRLKLSVYPNPAADDITVVLPDDGKVQWINAQGQILNEMAAKHGRFSIPLADYAAGIYYLRVQMRTATLIEKIVVVR